MMFTSWKFCMAMTKQHKKKHLNQRQNIEEHPILLENILTYWRQSVIIKVCSSYGKIIENSLLMLSISSLKRS